MAKRNSPSESTPAGKVLGRRAFAAISAVEGLKLSKEGRQRVESNTSLEQRRSDILRAYSGAKKRK